MAVFRDLTALAVLTALNLTSAAQAAPLWRSHGPDGGFAQGVAVDPANPSTVYASVPGGMRKTTNGGASWFDASVGMAHHDQPATSIVVDPSDSNVVYAANGQDGVWKSTNGGASWTLANTGLPINSAPFSLAIDPSAPSTLYVALFASGVYKSTDGAASWSPADTGLPVESVFAVAIHSGSPTTVWASVNQYGVFKTTDGGASWNPAGNGLPLGVQGLTLASSSSKPNQLYLGTINDGVLRSTNGGNSWEAVNNGLPFLGGPWVAVSPGNANDVYTVSGNTFFRSSSGGDSWTAAVTAPTGNPGLVAIDPEDPTTMYITTSLGMCKSDNRGRDWDPINVGFNATEVHAVAVDPVTPTTTFAATSGLGVFKSTDGTASWNAVNNGISSLATTGVVIDPSNPNTVYASTGAGVSKTVNGGNSWTDADSGIPGGAGGIIIDPLTPATLYAHTSSSVYKTTNGGGAWGLANTGIPVVQIWGLVIDPATPATVYAATSGGVYKTVDGGGSWNPMNTGFVSLNLNALAIDPMTPTTLYAGGANSIRVYTTTNGGMNWTQTDTVSSGVLSLAVDPTTPSTVYAGSYGGGVLRSTTSGTDFGQINDGLSSWVVAAVTVDGAGTPYAGTAYAGVAVLTDCGNGAQEVGEQCDDGNGTSGDGCSATCTLEPCGATPTPFCRIARQAQMSLSEKTPGKERLKLQWKKVTGVTTLADFGDPIGGSTSVLVCLYDDDALVASYQVDRAGDPCDTKPCWSAKGTTGFGYKDKLAAASGITKIGFKAGASAKGKADMAGANNDAKNQTALPTGVVAALAGSDAPTVQLFTSDGLCIGATMTDVTKDADLQYKAKK